MNVTDGSADGNYGNTLSNEETYLIGPGQASVIDSVFPEAGLYVGVGHAMNHVLKGGAFAVLAADNSTATDHPTGTWVPPKGYPSAGAPADGKPPAMSGSNQTAATATAGGGGGASSNQTAATSTTAEGSGGSATGIPGM
jgi:nitrite reductase (NO-forming)